VQQANPGKQIEVWFEDEAGIGQQGTLTRCWAQRGTRPTAVKQTEYEWVYLFGAVNPVTGESSALLSPSVNTEYMNHHLRFISEQVDSNVQVVLVVDNAGWHSAKSLRIPQNITLFYLPAYSPELNPVERLWSYLKSHFLSNRAYSDYDDLFSACRDAWNRLTVEQLCSICQTEWLLHEK
jgi:transposase